MAYAVQQRTQEIGIRMALGASPEGVRRMVVWQGMRLAGIGVVVGVVAALELKRFMAGVVFRGETWGPPGVSSLGGLLSRAAWVAPLGPARRGSQRGRLITFRELRIDD